MSVKISDLADIPVDANVPQLSLDAFYMDDNGKEIRNPLIECTEQGKCGQGVEMVKLPLLLVTCLSTKTNGLKLSNNMECKMELH